MGTAIDLMMLLGSLQVETSTPDALCPPLDLVRRAVESRVGELRGETQVATYRVVRSPGADSDVIELVLTNEKEELLFERRLPLGEMACSDAATTIAFLLERYFEELTPRSSNLSSASAVAITAPPATPLPTSKEPDGNSVQGPERVAELAKPEEVLDGEKLRFALHFQAGVIGEPGVHLGLGLEMAFTPSWSASLDTIIPLHEQREEVEEGLFAHSYNPVLLASLRYQGNWGDWSLGGGPLGLAWLQWGQVESTELVSNEGSKFRHIWGVGAQGSVRYSLLRTFQFELGVRVAPLFTGAVSSFYIEGPGESKTEILHPQALFSDVFLGARALF